MQTLSPTPPQRHRSRTPGRERAVDRLAETLERMATAQPRSRQAVELPIFSGAPTDWLPFKAAMRETTARYKIPPAENIARLRTCLRGEARETVAPLLYTATDPDQIMMTLEQCFGHPEIMVDRALADLRKLPQLGTTALELNRFAVKLQNIVCVLENIDDRNLINPMLTREVTSKLSPHLNSKWCDYAEENVSRNEPQLKILSRFLMREANRALRFNFNNSAGVKSLTKKNDPVSTRTSKSTRNAALIYTATAEPDLKQPCLCCGGDHEPIKCKKLRNMSVSDRWEWAKKERLCFRCLKKKHQRASCTAKKCTKDQCPHSHHPLLHSDPKQPSVKEEKRPDEEIVASTTTLDTKNKSKILLKICPVTIEGPDGKTEDTFALLDEGSTTTIVDEDLARRVNAQGRTQPLHIHAVSSTQIEPTSRLVRLKIRAQGAEQSHEITARTMRNLTIRGQSVETSVLKKYKHLEKLNPTGLCYESSRPRILIGTDHRHLIVTREVLEGRPEEPAASRTTLGWVIHGGPPSNQALKDEEEQILHISVAPELVALEKTVLDHFSLDSLGIKNAPRPNPEEDRAVAIFNQTARRINGRFEVGLPWKIDNPKLPPNYQAALSRLRSIERKLDTDSALYDEYERQIQNLIDKGYAEECLNNEHESLKCWYLPHFAVRNPNKPNKAARLVFDAAAICNGSSLNDHLLEGPDLLQSLMGILFRFRERPVAVTADIEEMFLRVKIRPEDQPAQLFLWRGKNRSSPPRAYKLTSMFFGAKSSPFLAHSVKNKNADDYAALYPEAAHAIKNSHYMDDYVDSMDTTQEAVKIAHDVALVHSKAGFRIRSWNSNSPQVLETFPPEDRSTQDTRLGPVPSDSRTLGLMWMAKEDRLSFNTAMNRVPVAVRELSRAPTKREALSAVMSVFDPLGLISQYTITAKIQLQELWRSKLGWDEPIPTEAAENFQNWLQNLTSVADLRLKRQYDCNETSELHIFNDASEQAYATAAYWRTIKPDGSVAVTLIAAKAKVAPLKTQTIPRLELQAALIGTRLAKTIVTEHRLQPVRTIYWTDSRTVLHWIQNDRKRYTTYVAHRLGEISELSDASQWRWLPTEMNVADDATRANFEPVLITDRWFQGPQFLREPEETWPILEEPEEPLHEIVAHISVQEWSLPEIERFSSHEKLIRTTARVLYFIDLCRKRASELELRHIEAAELLWMKRAQEESYPEETAALKAGKNITRGSRLHRLDPQLDENGLMRARGRIDAAEVSDHMKRPILLDGRHPYTRLLVQNEHEKAGHANNERVVNDLRQRYWIQNLRPTVRSVALRCQLCRVRKSNPTTPSIGNLPGARLEPYTRPFTNCGVDYFGPMHIKIGRRREKRWGALFTCLCTRAVHLEVVPTLTTDSAIMALRRMASRRGWPRIMYSDNGTNFRGADVELRNAFAEWAPVLKDFALTKRMEWRFIPPGAPNQGGAWERLVRSVKTALKATLTEQITTEEVLHTLLTEAEHAINGRPLTHVPVDPDDPEALTPNHFLIGSSSGLPVTGPCELADRRAWRRTQALADTFWKRWLKEYLPTLVPRGGITTANTIKKGDFVVVVDPNSPRNIWPRGIVTQTHTGPDGVIRSVEIQTRGSLLHRPIRKIAVLPVESVAASTRRGEDVTDGANIRSVGLCVGEAAAN